MPATQSPIVNLKSKIRLYWPLIKSTQTGLLLATGIAGYLSAGRRVDLLTLLGLALSLLLAISGSTIMNMWYDHDIDAKMKRTHKRPAASGELSQREVFWVGAVVSTLGVGWTMIIAPPYGLVVFAGWFFDVIVGTPLASRDVPGERGRLSSCIWNLGFFSERRTEKLPLRVDFIHRVEFGEVSGHRVLIKRGPGNRGPTEYGTTHEATSGMSS